MHKLKHLIVQQRRYTRTSLLLTAMSALFLLVVFFTAPSWVMLVFSLGFLLGYGVERVRVLRAIEQLAMGSDSSSAAESGGAA